jgi:integrase
LPRREQGIVRYGDVYYFHGTVDGVRVRKSLRTKDYETAVQKKQEVIEEVRKYGRPVIVKGTLEEALEDFIDRRRLHKSGCTIETDEQRRKPLVRLIGTVPLKQITRDHILKYQQQRLVEKFNDRSISARTVNMEVALLRKLMRHHRVWYRVADGVEMLPEHSREPRILTRTEECRLIEISRMKDIWLHARCAVMLSVSTSMRSIEIKHLRWQDLDFDKRLIYVRRSKTEKGHRVIPMNSTSLAALLEMHQRGTALKIVQPQHYVFCGSENGYYKGPKPLECWHNFNPDKPIQSWRSAWRSLLKAAKLTGLHFHDLRHLAITKMCEQGVPESVMLSVAGHVSQKMLRHYSHPRIEAMRQAVEKIDTLAIPDSNRVESETTPTTVN